VLQYPKDLGLAGEDGAHRGHRGADPGPPASGGDAHAAIASLLENNVARDHLQRAAHAHGPVVEPGRAHGADGAVPSPDRVPASPCARTCGCRRCRPSCATRPRCWSRSAYRGMCCANIAKNTRSGDPENLEARGAAHYWRHLFPGHLNFVRHRFGDPPNNLLNYGYAILRAIGGAGAWWAAGLLPTLGIHHRITSTTPIAWPMTSWSPTAPSWTSWC
jgi:CRISPR-associated protein Cas1